MSPRAGRPIEARLRDAARRLSRDVAVLRFASPVTHVYNPLEYARLPNNLYLKRFGNSRKRVVFVGMNPGPYGMAQTGVPFGEVSQVRDWLGIEAPVGHPQREHPKRPVNGFDCTRSEISGTRVWGAIAAHFGTPERFFANHFIANYCPLVFMEESGRNRTPDKLPARERDALFAACDRHLRALVGALEPEWLIAIGAFAEQRIAALGAGAPRLGRILHPSPASPAANKDWVGVVRGQLRDLGICRSPA
jgi:single-strand selective monofunctional uracil DNA glycosylase